MKNRSFLYFESSGNYAKKKRLNVLIHFSRELSSLTAHMAGRPSSHLALPSYLASYFLVMFACLQRISQCVCVPSLAVPRVEAMALLQGCAAGFLSLPGFLCLRTCYFFVFVSPFILTF